MAEIDHSFQVEESKELGRHLVAIKSLEPEDVVFVASPLLVGPRTQKLEKGEFPCVGCLKALNGKNYKHCPGCNWPCCSTTCKGLKLEDKHGFECQVLRLRPADLIRKPFFEYFRFDVLSIIRALSLMKLDKKKWDTLLNLQDHHEIRIVPNTKIYRLITEKLIHVQVQYLKPFKDSETEKNQSTFLPNALTDLIHQIYGILETNAVYYTKDGMDAMIIYPAHQCLLEHNCVPNVTEDIDAENGFKLSLRVVMPIKEKEHLNTSYLYDSSMTLWGTCQRRKYLNESRFLLCKCKRCLDPTELDSSISGLICLGTEEKPCGGTQLPESPLNDNTKWICNKCNMKLQHGDIMELVNFLTVEVDKRLEKQLTIEEMEDLLGKLLFFLHPNHYLVYTVKHRLLQMYYEDESEVSNESLHHRLTMCEEMIEVTKKIDPGKARLSLYLTVLLNCLFSLKFKFLCINFKKEESENAMVLIEEILNIIDEAKSAIKHDTLSEDGKKLHAAVGLNEVTFSNWINKNGIKI